MAVLGGSGGMNIIPAVIQVFLNCFVLKMKPLDAVESARVYHMVKKKQEFLGTIRFTNILDMKYLTVGICCCS